MKKLFLLIHKIRTQIPTKEQIFASKWLKPFEPYFNKSYYWNINRKNVALAVAVGMFCGLMPGPTQILTAFVVAYILKTNLSIAVFTTLYTNPFTYVPLYYIAYKLGLGLINGGISINQGLSLKIIANWNFEQLMHWFNDNLIYLMVGVPSLGIILALMSYFIVLNIWKYYILSKKKKLKLKKYLAKKNTVY